MFEKLFKLKANNTKVSTEILAGVTTFFTMAYIIFVNPQILGTTGMDANAVMLATCIAAAVGTLLTAFLANLPFAQAPGMGLNAFFAFTICGTLGYSWQQALAAVFISGILFIICTVTGLRTAIVRAIPAHLKKAIAAGIGLFIALIGLSGAGQGGIIEANPSTIVSLGDLTSPVVILTLIGLLLTAVLMVWKVRGALFIGIIGTSLIGLGMQEIFGLSVGISIPTEFGFSWNLGETFGQFDFAGLFKVDEGLSVMTMILSVASVLITLTMVDMFDTIGTLVGTATKAKMLDKDGNVPRGDRALLADAIATSAGAVLGTSTVTTYVESAAGISEGGRTGLTSVVVAILFLVAIFLSPILGFIPAAATAPALIIVGVLMVSTVKDIEWDEFEVAFPAFLTLIVMPLSYSIADGIAAGCISYTLIKMFRGKFKEVHPIMYVISILFILRFVLLYMQL